MDFLMGFILIDSVIGIGLYCWYKDTFRPSKYFIEEIWNDGVCKRTGKLWNITYSEYWTRYLKMIDSDGEWYVPYAFEEEYILEYLKNIETLEKNNEILEKRNIARQKQETKE